ncbi:aldo/keto reductase [Leptospira haakeii]|uniref:Aldo/keto reductase n=1 Tax=Leptospira haakeii TaxID=2023198 RepID=A0ABX4PM22_9LEPT|nr:aldo/keto reductase [Leptospira haakeii]PKA16088.1 aldo/keto reductase [Leptospira haakeii]PKA19125.1 aldo/keto reductase [Leptospira haakeii]
MSTIKKIKLGSQGLIVPIEGLGCMGMSEIAGQNIYGPNEEKESIATIHRSLELGVNFLDTADLYGPLVNERLIAKAIRGNRDKYIIATKFGFEINDQDQLTWNINGHPEYVKKAAERSLKNLGTDHVDLYYLHRMDPNIPIEETVGAMSELVKEGKVKYIGLSEVGSETIQKAHRVHPLSAIQSEYSLFERDIERLGILNTLKELGIGLVAYSPLGRGFLTGRIQSAEDLDQNDFRKNIPRFQGDQFQKNLELVKEIQNIASAKGITPSQLALAWVFAKDIVAIPGTKKIRYLEENSAAANISLTSKELEKIESIIPMELSTGNRYDDRGMSIVNQ